MSDKRAFEEKSAEVDALPREYTDLARAIADLEKALSKGHYLEDHPDRVKEKWRSLTARQIQLGRLGGSPPDVFVAIAELSNQAQAVLARATIQTSPLYNPRR